MPVMIVGIIVKGQNCNTFNTIGGKIYIDYNFNGLNDESLSPVEGVTVEAYDATGNIIASDVSNSSGEYTLAVPDGLRARVEFTNIPDGLNDGYFGADNMTTVQFITSPNCDADVALASGDCSCDNDPPIIIPCYVNGDPSIPIIGERAALLTVDYDQRGSGANYATYPPTAGDGGMPNVIGTAGEVGAVWAVSWDRRSNTAFSSSVVKRFSGFGPLGVGGIYSISDPTGNSNVSPFLDLAPCIGMGNVPRPDLGSTPSDPVLDVEGYAFAGKAGIGGIDVSSDGMFLYAVSLSTKELIQVRLRNTPSGQLLAGSCANVTSFPIPAISNCSTADSRPWAVQEYNGKVHVGVVCSAESSGDAADLTVEVFAFDPTTSNWEPVFGNPQSLNYPEKGCAAGIGPPEDNGFCCEWNPWLGANDYSFTGPTTYGFICNPQPILSDIEFDVDGSMILGFMDRFGLQVGWQNYHVPNTGNLNNDNGENALKLNANNDFDTEILDFKSVITTEKKNISTHTEKNKDGSRDEVCLNIEATIGCNLAGTPGDTSDDFIEFTVVNSNGSGSGYNLSVPAHIDILPGSSGVYGEVITFELHNAIGNGDFQIEITDNGNANCQSVQFNVSDQCSSNTCMNLEYAITCNNNNTPNITSDDYLQLIIDNSSGQGTGYNLEVPPHVTLNPSSSGQYNMLQTFDLINALGNGDFTVTIVDNTNPNCSLELDFQDECPSNLCIDLDLTISCSDNNTADQSDDFFLFESDASGIGNGYYIEGPPHITIVPDYVSYGNNQTFEVYGAIDNGSYSLTFTDDSNNNCVAILNSIPDQCLNQFNGPLGPLYAGMAGGDILYAYNDDGTYVLSTGKDILDTDGNVIRTGCGDDPDFLGEEFYCADNVAGNHNEGFHGGLAVRKGFDELIGTFVDAGLALGSQQVNAGGVQYIKNSTGIQTDYYSVYYNGGNFTLGKAAGVGDVEFMCDPPPIEVGNYVWLDLNKNGVQDPDELPIPDITIDLYSSNGTLLGSTTTNNQGEYYFNSLTSNMPEDEVVYIVIRDYDTNNGLGTLGHLLTVNDNGTNDLHDSDGLDGGSSGIAAIGNRPYIQVMTGTLGWVDHSYDFGFFPNVCFVSGIGASIIDCNEGDEPNTFDIEVFFSWINSEIGDEIVIDVDNDMKTYTVTTVDGEHSLIFTVPAGVADIPISVTNIDQNMCGASTSINTLPTNLTGTVSLGPCEFDPISLVSTATLSVMLGWSDLQPTDEIIVVVGAQTEIFTTGSIGGTNTIPFTVASDGSVDNEVYAYVISDPCVQVKTKYDARNECPECTIRISPEVGECIYDPTSGQSTQEVVVNLEWFFANPGDINVSIGSGTDLQMTTIQATTSEGGDQITFVMPADGSINVPINASFVSDSQCNGSAIYDARELCEMPVDLALDKFVDEDCPVAGSTVTWTVVVTHQGDFPATNVQVTDYQPSGLNYNNVYSATQGTFDGALWDIGSLQPGDVVTLTFETEVLQSGTYYNVAEITNMTEIDIDSNPGNNADGEDDISEACITVEYQICQDETIEISAESGFFNYQWYKDDILLLGETNIDLTISDPGTYTYTATTFADGGLPFESCCPVKVSPEVCNCEISITDVKALKCIKNEDQTTTTVTICGEWENVGDSETINFNVSGTISGDISSSLLNQPSKGEGCLDFEVALNEGLMISLSATTCNTPDQIVTTPDHCPPCAITIDDVSSPSPCTCNADNNEYMYSVNVSWDELEIGDIINFIGSGYSTNYEVNTTSGTHSFSVTGVADGTQQNIFVNVERDTECGDMAVINAPDPCCPPLCKLEIVDVIESTCMDNTVDIIVNVEWMDANANDVIIVDIGGNTQTSDPISAEQAEMGAMTFIANVPAPSTGNIAARFGGNTSCSDTDSYSVITSCPSCELDIESVNVGECYYDELTNESYFNVEVCLRWANAFSGDLIRISLGDQIEISEQQSVHYILDNTSGSVCKTITAIADLTMDMDITANFAVTPCRDERVDEVDAPQPCTPYDLALRKILDTSGPHEYGQNLTFTIEVFNQYQTPVQNFEIIDYIPNGYSFDPNLNPGWVIGTATDEYTPVTYTFNQVLNPSESVSTLIVLRLNQSTGTPLMEWDNYAEISYVESIDGFDISSSDLDSTPGSDLLSERAVKPGDPADNNITSTDKGGEEDDHDPAGPEIVDIALRKTTITPGPYVYGMDVDFQIDVINQGNVILENIDVTDYIPCGFGFDVTKNPGWVEMGSNAVFNLSDRLIPGDQNMQSIILTLSVKPCYDHELDASIDPWLNYAEVSYMEDENGNDVSSMDIDSESDNINGNDPGGNPDGNSDNVVTGVASGQPGHDDPLTDEDDHDPERIEVFDLALKKILTTVGPHEYGDFLNFEITVYNQGNVTATSFTLTDYMPDGYRFVTATNSGWSQTGPNSLIYNNGLLGVGQNILIPLQLELIQTTGGEEDWINYVEITDVDDDNDGGNTDPEDADSNEGSNNVDENAVQPGDPFDNDVLSTDKGGEEDDHDPAGPEIVDIALRKTTVTGGPYVYNMDVRFNIEIFNQGSIALEDIDIQDYIPCGFYFDPLKNTNWIANVSGAFHNVPGVLVPGDSYDVDIVLTVQACYAQESGSSIDPWLNYAEVSYMEDEDGNDVSGIDIDSESDNIIGNDPGGNPDGNSDDVVTGIASGQPGHDDPLTDEDDHDPERIEVFDLALKKILLTTGPHHYGQFLDFEITVYNQGNEDATSFELSDYMPDGYKFSTATNTGWVEVNGNLLTYQGGALASGDHVVIPLQLELIMTTGGEQDWINYVEISDVDNDTNPGNTDPEDADSVEGSNGVDENAVQPRDPEDNDVLSVDKFGEEDDHDPDGPEIVDIALRKTTVTTGPYLWDQSVTFMIEIFNQGSITLQNIEITDYIPCGFMFDPLLNGNWVENGSRPTTVINGPLVPGAMANVMITLNVYDCYEHVLDNSIDPWVNYAEVSYMEDFNGVDVSLIDIDSDANDDDSDDKLGVPDGLSDDYLDGDSKFGTGDPGMDEDDHDPERIEIFDLALRKTIENPGPYVPEDFIDFEITIFNQGNVNADNIFIIDYFPACFILFDDQWVDNGNSTASYELSTSRGTLAAALEPGDSTKVAIRLKNNLCQPGYEINWAEISAATKGDGSVVLDVDSTPDTTRDNDGGGAPEYLTDDWIEGQGGGVPFDEDNPGGPGDDDTQGDEDDQDPEQVEVILFADLALIKVLGAGQLNPVNHGDIVNFDIIVQNQGPIEVDSFVVNDYMPPCLTLVSPDWVPLGNGSAEYVVSLENGRLTEPMVTGDQIIIPISFTVDPCADGVIENWAEISAFRGPGGSIIEDIDSYPDDDLDNDNYSPDDNNVWTEDGKNGGDEDDHDPEQITVVDDMEELFDLALRKKLAQGQPMQVNTGDVVVFDIEIYNQGTISADNIEITDYFPSCFTMVDADWEDNGDNTATIELSTSNGGLMVPLQPGQGTVVQINLLLASCPSGNYTNWAEISAATDSDGNERPDVDSTPDNNQGNDNYNGTDNVIDQNGKLGGDEDDHDPALVEVVGDPGFEFDLALIKVKANGQPNPVEDGDLVTFEIEISNQGDISADNIEITDYLPSCLVLQDNDWTDNGDGTASIMLSVANGELDSPLLPGSGVSVFITTMVNGCSPGPITNWAEISGNTDSGGQSVVDIDSTPDDDQVNDVFTMNDKLDGDGKNGIGEEADEDDHDPESITVVEIVEELDTFDLALFKVLHPGQAQQVMANDVAVFDLEITNQGNMLADNIEITDYIPSCLTLNDATWTDNGDGTASKMFSVANGLLDGPLAPGQNIQVTIRFLVNECADTEIVNWSEISAATDGFGDPVVDIDSTPDANEENDKDNPVINNEINEDGKMGGDEDDHDYEPLIYLPPPPVYDIALIKTLPTEQNNPVNVGEDVSFDIQITNQGDYVLDNIEVIDYIPNCFSLNDGAWTDNNNGTASITLPNALAPNQSVIVTIVLRVENCTSGSYLNWAEVSGFTNEMGEVVEDLDSWPDTDQGNDNYPEGADNINNQDGKNGGDEDDHDPEEIYVIPVSGSTFDLALTKVLREGQPSVVTPGSSVTFDIEIYNQSDVLADNIEITDYLPSCAVLNDGDWIDNGNGTASILLSVGNGGLMSPLGQNESVIVPITITLSSCADGVIVNWSEISGATDENGDVVVDIDSTPDNDPDNDNYDDSDNVIDEDGRNGGDEDDHDPAEVTVETSAPDDYDLALLKVLVPGQTLEDGGLISFMIEVYNQGNVAADNIEVTDYIPDCLVLNDAGWVNNGDDTATKLVSVANNGLSSPLQPGDKIQLYITFTLTGCPLNTEITNWSEISGGTDGNGNVVDDVDSYPDNDPDNDFFMNDNDISGNWKLFLEDEDDHDPASFELKDNSGTPSDFDLALIKVLQTGQPVIVENGDIVMFDIYVVNQGDLSADNIEITDYLPSCMSLSDPDWTDNGNGTASIVLSVANGGLPSVLGPDDYVIVPINVSLSGCSEGDITNWAEISSVTDGDGDPVVDIDSTPDNDQGNDNFDDSDNELDEDGKNGGDEDDHDPETVTLMDMSLPIFDLALTKTLPIGQSRNVPIGATVTFNVNVVNQGNVFADNIEITDYLPSCAVLQDNDWVDNGDGTATKLLSVANGELNSPLSTGQQVTVPITLKLSNCGFGEVWNWAEISGDTDGDGNEVTDVDSWPDKNQADDTYVTDNYVGGNANNPGEDEDDHDPEYVIVDILEEEDFDLALIKRLAPGQNYQITNGEIVSFEITVINQGNVAADEIRLVDYIPSCMSLADASWTAAGGNTAIRFLSVVTGELDGPLLPGQQVKIPISLLANGCPIQPIINWAEISDARDSDGNVVEDIDSTPDDDFLNDIFENDDDISGDAKNLGEDEDDHDLAEVELVPVQDDDFDLALIKVIASGQSDIVEEGDLLTFEIQITNQGDIAADNIEITDYYPSCISLEDSDWLPGSGYTATKLLSVANGGLTSFLQPGQSILVPITFRIGFCEAGEHTNWAEISNATDPIGDSVVDIDSTPDNNPDNDNYDDSDNITDEDGKNGGDEDDHDPEVFEVAPMFDLALRKIVTSTGPYRYGDIVDFEIRVFNQGNQQASNIEISDYLPAGYSFDAGINTGWSVSGPDMLKYTYNGILGLGQELPILLRLNIEQTDGGSKDWDNYAEISDATDENGDPVVDIDSYPDDFPNNDNDVMVGDENDDVIDEDAINDGGDEDDHDPAGIDIFDLAQTKVTENKEGPYFYGDIVRYEIRVYNQGNTSARNVEITDYIPCGLKYVSSNDGVWTYDTLTQRAKTVFGGTIVPGSFGVVYIDLEVQQCIDMDEDSFTNYTEISDQTDDEDNPVEDIDSMTDDNEDNDTGGEPDTDDDDNVDGDKYQGEDEDDHDPERIDVFDLALIKELNTINDPYRYGDLLEFEITVCNQGNVDAENIVIEDYLPTGYGFDFANNPDWGGTVTTPTYEIPGVLLQDNCTSFLINLTIEQTTGGEKDWINYAEIISSTDDEGVEREDADSMEGSNGEEEQSVEPGEEGDNDLESTDKGGEEDDHDPAGIELYDLAQRKVLNEQGPFKYGDVVSFTIEVFNQGSIAASNVEITDYIPCGYRYEASNGSNGWVYDGDSGRASVILPKVLAAGESTTVVISLRLRECYEDEANAWTNYTEISDGDSEDPDYPDEEDVDSMTDDDKDNDMGGTPGDPTEDDNVGGDKYDGEDEDDHDPEIVPIFDLAILKTIDSVGPYTPGTIAPFRIKVYNQGNVTAYNVEITDYLNAGYSFDMGINPEWELTPAGLLQTEIAGPFEPGDSMELALNLMVIVPDGAKIGDWYNEVEISGGENEEGEEQEDADSYPDTDPDNDNELVDGDDEDIIFDEGDDNDDVIDENIDDPFGEGDDDEDDNDAAEILVVGGLGDTVWKDIDGDGIQDEDEPGQGGIVVSLYNCEGVLLDITVSDADGFYFFNNLIPGDYQLHFDIGGLPEGCDFTFQDQGDDDELDSDVDLDGWAPCTHIDGGEYDSTFDAGLLILAEIGDLVWHDVNGDGIQDADESGIEDILVKLKDELGEVIQTTYTDENGNYLFDNLYPGNYSIMFSAPDGMELTFLDIGDDEGVDSDADPDMLMTSETYLEPGESDLSWDAGFYFCAPIGDLVWYDIDEDDVWDSTENGINGLKVNLWKHHFGEWQVWETTYTGHKPGTPSDDGWYKFCAPPGEYYVEIILPPYGLVPAVKDAMGYIELTSGNEQDGDSDLNSEGKTDVFTVLSGEEVCNIGGGYYPQAEVGNLVWHDVNENGVQDTGEPRMADVTVKAYNASGEMIKEVVTDSNGEYHIDYLQKQSYYLKFEAPSGYGFTTPNAGNENMDSDVDGSNGPNTTKLYSFMPGDSKMNVDAGVAFGVLPVKWLGVRAERVGEVNEVLWRTGSEVNVDRYEVYGKMEGSVTYRKLGEVKSKGNNQSGEFSYSMQDDESRRTGIYYYYVKSVDYDGRESKSKEVELRVRGDRYVRMYPNPAIDKVNIELSIGEDVSYSVSIYTEEGKLVKKLESDVYLESGDYEERYDLSGLTSGVYTVKITLDDEVINKKLIIVE